MKNLKILSSLILIILLVVPSFCFATNKTINFRVDGVKELNIVKDLEVSIYKIGTTNEIGEPTLNSEIDKLNIDIRNLNQESINILADFVKEKYKPEYVYKINAEGEFNINNISKGVYIFVQNNKFDEIKMQSLVTWGSNNNDEIIKIRPKIETIQQEAVVEENYDEKLPQTGIIYWPIPMLAIGGILIFAIGWYLIFVKSKKKLK